MQYYAINRFWIKIRDEIKIGSILKSRKLITLENNQLKILVREIVDKNIKIRKISKAKEWLEV